MESKFSFVLSHEPTTGPYPEPAGPTPQPTMPLIRTHFNFIFSSKLTSSKSVFLNRRAAARYRALASILPAGEKFWNLSF